MLQPVESQRVGHSSATEPQTITAKVEHGKGINTVRVFKFIQGRVDSMCKDPEVGTRLAGLQKSREQ